MKIADFFKNPVKTWCEVDGAEIDVMVECDYHPAEHNAAEQAEVCEVRNMRGISVMGAITMMSLEDLEDRLLAMAKSAHSSRVEDWQEFAREMQQETLAMGLAQRGSRPC